jgi:hypothetical protein
MKKIIFSFLAFIILSCKSEIEQKQEIVNRIGNSYNSEIIAFSADLISQNEVIGSTVGLVGDPISKIADCILKDVEQRLVNSYSINELKEIENNDVKKLAVLDGLLSNEDFKIKSLTCIKAVFEDYDKTRDKIKNSTN